MATGIEWGPLGPDPRVQLAASERMNRRLADALHAVCDRVRALEAELEAERADRAMERREADAALEWMEATA